MCIRDRGLAYTLIITKTNVRIELGISTSSKERNKVYFSKLLSNKEVIEQSFGGPLVWEEFPDNKVSIVRFELHNVNLYDETDWLKMNNFFITYLPKFESAIQPFIKDLK